MNDRRERRWGGSFMVGLVLIVVGLVIFLDRFGLVEIDVPWGWWPLILVALGAGRVLQAASPREAQGGLWLIVLGVWLILNFEGYFGLDWENSWPILIVALGALMIWRTFAEAGSEATGGGSRRGPRGPGLV